MRNVKVVIPFQDFEKIYRTLPESRKCQGKWCPFSRTTCHVRECLDGITRWWNETNGKDAPGLVLYDQVFKNAIQVENRLYWHFWTRELKPCHECYDEIVRQVRLAFAGEPIDTDHQRYYPNY